MPERSQNFSKNEFLNKQIEAFYKKTEAAILDKMSDIKKMKKRVE
jgi:hypothetical protein